MSVTSIDMITMPQKSQETSTFQKNHLDHAANGEQKSGEIYQNQVQRNMHKTVEAKQKKESEFQFDAKNKGQNEYENMRKKKGKKEKKQTIFPSSTGSSFDITI